MTSRKSTSHRWLTILKTEAKNTNLEKKLGKVKGRLSANLIII